MHLEPNHLYHIYNQGNNQGQLFFERDDYLHFLKKYRGLIAPHCSTLAYCLMPNHFHFLIDVSAKSVQKLKLGNIETSLLSNGFRLLLSEFAQEINQKYGRSGSLFRQKTKAKILTETGNAHSTTCFHYLHQNPLKARLVRKMEDREFSSFQDYAGLRLGTLCNQSIAFEYLLINWQNFYRESAVVISKEVIPHLYIT